MAEFSPLNPFNSVTRLKHYLSAATNVRIRIFNINVKFVETLFDKFQEDGVHSIHWQATNLPSGTYIGQIRSGVNRQIVKMVLVRWGVKYLSQSI